MKIVGIIPARYASTRFPGKPLVMIGEKSMIQRVYEQSKRCNALSNVIVATDSDVIYKHVRHFGGEVKMTSENHTSGTERCAEVLSTLGPETYDAVINIQGDEPFIDPDQISLVANLLANPLVEIATLIKKIENPDELTSPNVVKAVTSIHGEALYFSRSSIPYLRGKEVENWLQNGTFWKHIGIYGYKANVLAALVQLPISHLEKAESLEQLRWLENGFSIHTAVTVHESVAIDIPEDLLKIVNKE